jgi:peptide/nickel transport system substrate-binding protein
VFESVRLRQLLAVLFAFALTASACGSGSSDSEDTSPAVETDDESETEVDDPPEADGNADENADGSDLETADPSAVQSGGVVRIGVEADPSSLNPTNTAFAVSAVLMGTAIFDTLVAFDENNQWVPNLSESWTSNEDFTAWDMTLRPGVNFSDGTPLDADAVLANLNAQISDPLIGLLFLPVFDDDNPFEKVDELTVRITPKGSNSALPTYFTTQLGMMASPTWLEASAADPALDQMPVGAGPFMVESRVQDSVTRVVRNDAWWRTDQEVFLDAVEFFPNNQENTRADQLLAGDLEMNHATDADSILRLREEDGISRIEDDQGEEFFLIFNTQTAPFDDLRVRQAATHAFPRAEYTEFIMRGSNSPAESLFAPGLDYHVDTIEQVTDQPELAEPLISAYCADVPESCTEGRVDIEYQYNGPSLSLDDIAGVIGSAWAPFFNITTQVVPQDDFILEVALGQFDVTTWRYHGQLDPEVERAFLTCSTILAISINWSRYCDPDRDVLLDAQRETTDQAERVELWRQIQENIDASRQYLLISHTNWIVAADERVNGVCDAQSPDGVKLRCSLNGSWYLPQVWLAQ